MRPVGLLPLALSALASCKVPSTDDVSAPLLELKTRDAQAHLESGMVDALERFRVERIGGMNVVQMALAACAAAVRKQWVATDAGAAVETAERAFVAKRAFQAALARLAPPRTEGS